ncbi:MAG: hypothetical protein AB7Q81_13460 [Gammaproteobacteria bacterium]
MLGRLRVLLLVVLLPLSATAGAWTIGDTYLMDVEFQLNGKWHAYNNLAFGDIDFYFRRNGAIIAEGHFDQGVGGGVSKSGVFSNLPLAAATYSAQMVNYYFTVPVAVTLGTPVSLQVDFRTGIIRGESDFYAAGSGLKGSLPAIDDFIDGTNTALYASVTLGTDQPSDTAVPPAEAHAFFDYNDYPHAIARVLGPRDFQLLVRPDGAPFVADFGSARINTTLTLVEPVPLPGAAGLAVSGLGMLGWRTRRRRRVNAG